MAKSRDAFRTISEVAEALDTPAHVLRFWESKFKQIKPVKRAGGRRYYRPDDIALLAAIKDLLHSQGHSIKDAQKLIRESGLKTIVSQGHSLLGQPGEAEIIEAPSMPPPAKSPVGDMQPDLFAGSEFAPPADTSSLVDETEDAAATPAASAIPDQPVSVASLPDLPEPRDDLPARFIGALVQADPDVIRANASQIAPLVAKLSALRDEMRHPW